MKERRNKRERCLDWSLRHFTNASVPSISIDWEEVQTKPEDEILTAKATLTALLPYVQFLDAEWLNMRFRLLL